MKKRTCTAQVTNSEVQTRIRQALAPGKSVLKAVAQPPLSTRFQNICEQVFRYSQESPTQQTRETGGTLFGAYNAITGYYQNLRSYRDEETKLRSLLFGGIAQTRTARAFQLCAEMAKDPALITRLN